MSKSAGNDLPQLRAAHELAAHTLPNLSDPAAGLVRGYRDGDLRRDLRRLPATRKPLLTLRQNSPDVATELPDVATELS